MQKAANACVSTLHQQGADPLSRKLFAHYFQDFYRATNLDKHGISELVRSNAPDESKLVSAVYSGQLPSHLVDKVTEKIAASLDIQFRSAATAFRLINDEDSATVIVRYQAQKEDIDMLLNTIAKEGPQRWSMRKLQRYSVTIKKRDADRLLARSDLSLPMPGLYVLESAALYHEQLGLLIDDVFNAAAYAI